MWPYTFGSIYTAKSATVIRKNAIVLPLYQLILLFVFFVGFAATLQVPGLTGSNIHLALFKLSVKTIITAGWARCSRRSTRPRRDSPCCRRTARACGV
jgi:hypothetical protein